MIKIRNFQAKKILRDFRQREIEMLHREEFYQQLLQEKDTEYNSLVKTLKDRIIRLEVLLLVSNIHDIIMYYIIFEIVSVVIYFNFASKGNSKKSWRTCNVTIRTEC